MFVGPWLKQGTRIGGVSDKRRRNGGVRTRAVEVEAAMFQASGEVELMRHAMVLDEREEGTGMTRVT